MASNPQYRRQLDEVLQSTSDVLFPEELGEKKVEMGSRNIYTGDTPLHVSSQRNDVHGAKCLIDAGANINAKGEMDETPLHVALRIKSVELVEALLQAGANPDIRSEFGETAREKANEMGGVFRTLIKQYCERHPGQVE
jgi:ankyrin repeat protein